MDVLHAFPDPPVSPNSSLVPLADGSFIGSTWFGGGGGGTLYRLNADGTVTYLHGFNGKGGERPWTSLAMHNGFLYGQTQGGGAHDRGTIFRVDPTTGAVTVLTSFSVQFGSGGQSGLRLGNGVLYGVISNGGTSNRGAIYKFDPASNQLSTVHSFTTATSSGRTPISSPTLASDGFLYGSTMEGGASGGGIVYRLDPLSGSLTTLHAFSTAAGEPKWPRGGLVQASDGFLYGTTHSGSPANSGGVYRLDPVTGAVTNLAAFQDATTGRNPDVAMIEGADGFLYGTTQTGGPLGGGVVFRFDRGTHEITLVKSFGRSGTTGWLLANSLVQAADGFLYGTAQAGGANLGGTIFKIDPATSAMTTLHGFGAVFTDGSQPHAGLTRAPDDRLYGTTKAGGADRQGIAYRLSPDSGAVEVLSAFGGPFNGANNLLGPHGPLVAAAGSLFGVAVSGSSLASDGAIFRIDPATGMLTIAHAFAPDPEPGGPQFGLTHGAGGLLYGTTGRGGAFQAGTVFSFHSGTGAMETVHSFDPANAGAVAESTLVAAPNGRLYGVTSRGGTSFWGAIYSIDPSAGTLSVDYSFTFFDPAGVNPKGGLTLGPDGQLYGMTTQNLTPTTSGVGLLFRFDPSTAAVTPLTAFGTGALTGVNPVTELALGPDGFLYGTTLEGGTFDRGTVYRLDPSSGVAETIYSLDSSVGRHPIGRLAFGRDRNLYGAAEKEGPSGGGTLFRLHLNSAPVAAEQSVSTPEDVSVNGTLNATDAEGDALSFVVVTPPAHGSVTITDPQTGAFSYTPSPNYYGADAFTFRADDGGIASDAATVTIDVTSVADAAQVVVSGGSFTFDGQPHSATGTVTGVFGESLGAPTLTYNGVATVPTAVGTYAVVGSFAGNADYLPGQATATLVIGKATTTIAVTTTPNPSSALEVVTLTAQVSATPGAGTPTGLVQFFDGAAMIGSAALSGAVARITWPGLSGAHEFTAVYAGDATFESSTSTMVTHTVNAFSSSTITALVASPSPSALGAPLTLYAFVVPAGGTGVPTGTVSFFDGATPIGAASLTTVSGYRVASLTVSSLSAGVHALNARYAGDTSYGGSQTPLTLHTVYAATAPAATTTTMSVTPSPSAVGQSLSMTISVQSPGGVPSGSVYLIVNGNVVAALPLSNIGGVGRVTVPIAGGLPRGLYVMSAVYVGTGAFAASSSQNVYQCVACGP